MRTLAILSICVAIAGAAKAQVNDDSLEVRDGIRYLDGAPYSGPAEVPGEREGRYLDGQRDGHWTWWYPNGRRSMTADFKANRLDGTMRHYDRDGNLLEEEGYRVGRSHGTQRVFAQDGSLLLVREWNDGSRHGAETWYFPDGSIRWSTRFANGTRTGTWRQYANDGTLIMESEWDEGRVVARSGDIHAAH